MTTDFDLFLANNAHYLDAMADAYLATAWWADSPEQCAGQHREPTKATRAAALADCREWCRAALAAGLNLTHASRPNLISADEAGHNLWLSRNGHGAGFWDNNPEAENASDGCAYRVWDDATGETAHNIAEAMKSRTVYVVAGRFAIE